MDNKDQIPKPAEPEKPIGTTPKIVLTPTADITPTDEAVSAPQANLNLDGSPADPQPKPSALQPVPATPGDLRSIPGNEKIPNEVKGQKSTSEAPKGSPAIKLAVRIYGSLIILGGLLPLVALFSNPAYQRYNFSQRVMSVVPTMAVMILLGVGLILLKNIARVIFVVFLVLGLVGIIGSIVFTFGLIFWAASPGDMAYYFAFLAIPLIILTRPKVKAVFH